MLDHLEGDTQIVDVQSMNDTHVGNDHAVDDTQQKDVPKYKNRKYPGLWQAYQWWSELVELRKRHLLRISAAERGVSQLDPAFEHYLIGLTRLDVLIEPKNKTEREKSIKDIMVKEGYAVGPIWEWCLSHKGIGEGLAAQLLAQIDDISHFDTVSKLWRFAGFAVFDGKAEGKVSKDIRHYNGRLNGVCFNIADQFIRQQTPYYVDIYYAEKFKQRELHPVPFCLDCNAPAEVYQKKNKGELVNATRCPERKKEHTIKWSDVHIHNMAWRKMVKEFLKDLWVKWNETVKEVIPIDSVSH